MWYNIVATPKMMNTIMGMSYCMDEQRKLDPILYLFVPVQHMGTTKKVVEACTARHDYMASFSTIPTLQYIEELMTSCVVTTPWDTSESQVRILCLWVLSITTICTNQPYIPQIKYFAMDLTDS